MPNPKIQEAADFLLKIAVKPNIFFVLGSGIDISSIASRLKNLSKIDCIDIPGFPELTVSGHAGKIIFGEFDGRFGTAFMFGRKHLYENASAWRDTIFIPELFSTLGANIGFFTSAAGAIDPALEPGDLISLGDILNMHGKYAPLYDFNGKSRGHYIPFDRELTRFVVDSAMDTGIAIVNNGVYASLTGPSFETPAEVDMLHINGVSVVGMSMAPELCHSSNLGIRCVGVSLVTNSAGKASNHDEVLKTASWASRNLTVIVERFLEKMAAKYDGTSICE